MNAACTQPTPESESWAFRSTMLSSLLATLGLFIFLSSAKIQTLHRSTGFDPVDDTGIFWTESAFHYRYAKLVANGQPLPEVDRAMQYPEGIQVYRDEMPVMELFYGKLYRLLKPAQPFHVFLLQLVCVYSSLVLVPLCIWAGWRTRTPAAPWLAGIFYVLTFPAIGAVVLSAFIRQDFALPILFSATTAWVIGIEAKHWRLILLGAALMTAAFASWHLSQFYYLVLLVGLVAAATFWPVHRDSVAKGILMMTVFLVLAGLCVPALRSGSLVISTPLLLSYAFVLTWWILRRRNMPRWGWFGVTAAFFVVFYIAIGLIAPSHWQRYSHVYRLIWDKIRFFGIKPDDPSHLCFESRVMWTSSFLSPGLRAGWQWMSGAWIAGLGGWLWTIRERMKKGWSLGDVVCLWMFCAFFVLYVLIQRMDVFLAFFLCLGAASVAQPLPHRTSVARWVAVVVLIGVSWHSLTSQFMVSHSPSLSDLRVLLQAIRTHTTTQDVILTHFPLGPVVCAFTDRPVVIHSKFENRRVREKVEEFYTAFFEPEEKLHAVCQKYQVRYVVYEPEIGLSTTKQSVRYMANRLDLTDEAVVVPMQFLPEALRWFQLVFQSERYRLFKVLDRARTPGPLPFPKLPIYDSRNFRREDVRIWPKGGNS